MQIKDEKSNLAVLKERRVLQATSWKKSQEFEKEHLASVGYH